jgi:hypothetical protein
MKKKYDKYGELIVPKYTFDICKELASKFETKIEFIKEYNSAYKEALKNGWLDDLKEWKNGKIKGTKYSLDYIKNLIKNIKTKSEFKKLYPNEYCATLKYYSIDNLKGWENGNFRGPKYSLEYLKELSKDLITKTDFKNKYPNEYSASVRYGLINNLKEWENGNNFRISKYTEEFCKELVKNIETKSEFYYKYPSAYSQAIKDKFIDKLKEWKNGKIHSKYTKEICINLAKNCKTRSEFKKKYPNEYDVVLKYGWMNELKDWIIVGDKYKRLIYIYLFCKDNGEVWFYVGLTCNIKMRHLNHLSTGPVHDFGKENNLEIINPIIMTEFLDVKEAQKMEEFYLQDGIKRGWKPINKGKTGGLGTCNNFYNNSKEILILK